MTEIAAEGRILGITEKHLTRASDNAPFTLWELETHPLGKLSTTKQEIAQQAQLLIDTPVLLTYTESQNGQYVNRYLKRVNLAAQQPNAQGALAPQAPLHATENAPVAMTTPYQNVSIGRDEAIWRQTATKTAASFNNKDLAEYWERVEMLLDFYRTGVVPGVAQEQPGVMPSQNTFIPPQPGDLVNPDVSDEDIPF